MSVQRSDWSRQQSADRHGNLSPPPITPLTSSNRSYRHTRSDGRLGTSSESSITNFNVPPARAFNPVVGLLLNTSPVHWLGATPGVLSRSSRTVCSDESFCDRGIDGANRCSVRSHPCQSTQIPTTGRGRTTPLRTRFSLLRFPNPTPRSSTASSRPSAGFVEAGHDLRLTPMMPSRTRS